MEPLNVNRKSPLVAALTAGGSENAVELARLLLRTGRACFVRWTMDDYLPEFPGRGVIRVGGRFARNMDERPLMREAIAKAATEWGIDYTAVHSLVYSARKKTRTGDEFRVTDITDILMRYAPGTQKTMWASMAKFCLPEMQRLAAYYLVESGNFHNKDIAEKTGVPLSSIYVIKASLPW